MKYLQTIHADETEARAVVDRSLDTAYRACQTRLDALTDLRIRGLLTDEEYAAKRQALLGEQLRLKERLADTDHRATQWRALAERAFIFANEAKERFETGSLEEKREILVALGSNLVLKDKNLRISLQEPFELIAAGLRGAPATSARFEPRELGLPQHETSGRATADSVWWALVDKVRTFFYENPKQIDWPKFCLEAIPSGGESDKEG